LYLNGQLQVFPAHQDAIFSDHIGQSLVHLSGFAGLYRYPQCVLPLIVLRAPLAGGFVENDCPAVLVWYGVEAVLAFGQVAAFDLHILAELDRGGLVGTGAPNFAVRYQFAPNITVFDRRAAVFDGYQGIADLAGGGGWR